jgi:hypothetical protein
VSALSESMWSHEPLCLEPYEVSGIVLALAPRVEQFHKAMRLLQFGSSRLPIRVWRSRVVNARFGCHADRPNALWGNAAARVRGVLVLEMFGLWHRLDRCVLAFWKPQILVESVVVRACAAPTAKSINPPPPRANAPPRAPVQNPQQYRLYAPSRPKRAPNQPSRLRWLAPLG